MVISVTQFNYEEMITRVATESNAVVPIVSFKELSKQDWRRLPRIISAGLQTRANMVICTHLDQVGALPFVTTFVNGVL